MLLDTLMMLSVIGITTLGISSAIRSIQYRLAVVEKQTQDRLSAESALSAATPTQNLTILIRPDGTRHLIWEHLPGRKFERLIK